MQIRKAVLPASFVVALATVLALVPGIAIGQAKSPVVADSIYLNGTIITVNDQQPTAEAIAVRAGYILAVGSKSEFSPQGTRYAHHRSSWRYAAAGVRRWTLAHWPGSFCLGSAQARSAASRHCEEHRGYTKDPPRVHCSKENSSRPGHLCLPIRRFPAQGAPSPQPR